MKNLKFIFVIFLSIVLSSCQFSEKITFNDQGGGRYNFSIDMSQMLKQAKEMDKENDSENVKKDEKSEVIDTLIFMKDIIAENKDSIAKLPAEERAKIESIKDLKMHIAINEDKDIALTEFILDFKNIAELRDVQRKISAAQNLNSKDKKTNVKQPTDVIFEFDGHTFHRKVVDNKLSDTEKEAYEQNLQQSMSILNSSSYQIEYHFPKPIKSTTLEGATFSADRKTLYYKTDMGTVVKDPKKLDFKVILE